MSFIKKVLNDSKEISKYYIIISIIYLVCCLTLYDFSTSTLVTLLVPLIFTAYFIYLKNDNGKRNFNSLNRLLSSLFMGCITIVGINALDYIFELDNLNLNAITTITTYILAISFYLYWIFVFYAKPETNKKVFNNTTKNNTIFNTILIGNIVILVINYLNFLDYGIMTSYLLKFLIIDLLSTALFILRLRYIYLFQDYKYGRSNK